ncbi:hypothetical protein DPMN_054224 [Dreissena polymorpha]|uniref:Uncharacterized protein n=1 Tax=Dreissena polymorpha TaxID=45954 RepID=A0A9D4CQ50_DREPO|nr:hypothetical protein DPMN_054224 [Dreissena polymorpha]
MYTSITEEAIDAQGKDYTKNVKESVFHKDPVLISQGNPPAKDHTTDLENEQQKEHGGSEALRMTQQVAFSEPANENAYIAINNLNDDDDVSESHKKNCEEPHNAYTGSSEIKDQGKADDIFSQMSETSHDGIFRSVKVAVTDAVNDDDDGIRNDFEQATSNIRVMELSSGETLTGQEQDTSKKGFTDIESIKCEESVTGKEGPRLVLQSETFGANISGESENHDSLENGQQSYMPYPTDKGNNNILIIKNETRVRVFVTIYYSIVLKLIECIVLRLQLSITSILTE